MGEGSDASGKSCQALHTSGLTTAKHISTCLGLAALEELTAKGTELTFASPGQISQRERKEKSCQLIKFNSCLWRHA